MISYQHLDVLTILRKDDSLHYHLESKVTDKHHLPKYTLNFPKTKKNTQVYEYSGDAVSIATQNKKKCFNTVTNREINCFAL